MVWYLSYSSWYPLSVSSLSFRVYSIPFSLRNQEKLCKIQSLETYEGAVERSSKNRFTIDRYDWHTIVRIPHHPLYKVGGGRLSFQNFCKEVGIGFSLQKRRSWKNWGMGCSEKGGYHWFHTNLSNVTFLCVSFAHLHNFYQYSLCFTGKT